MTSTTELAEVTLEERIDAFAALCAHHGDGARRLGRALLEQDRAAVSEVEVDQLIGRASAELWPSVASGEVAEAVVRPHLLAAVRREATPGAPRSRVVAAVATLPGPAQLELWRVEVEGRPSEAPERLAQARAAFPGAVVAAHEGTARRQGCETARPRLPAYAEAKLTSAETSRIAAHLAVCRPCSAVYLELAEARSDLPDLLSRAFLGAGATAYLAGLPPVRPAAGLAEALAQSRSLRVLGAGIGVLSLVLAGLILLATGVGQGGGKDPERGPVAALPVVKTPAPAPTPTPTPTPVRTPDQAEPPAEPSESAGQDTGNGNAQVTPIAQPPVTQPTQPPAVPTPLPTVPVPPIDPTATLTLTADDLAAMVQLDPGCILVGVGTASCTVAGDRTMSVASLPLLAPATMTVSVAPDGGLHDPSMADNTTSISLDGRV